MRLENKNPAAKNTKITVNGTTYQIGSGGFICDESGDPVDVPQADADRLLLGRAWLELTWDPSDPKNAGKLHPSFKGAKTGRPVRTMAEMEFEQGIQPVPAEKLAPQPIGSATSDGQLTGVETAPPSEEALQKAIAEDVEAAKASGDIIEEDILEHVEPVEQGEETTVPGAEAQTGADWPEPSEEMDIDYLRQMADAYEVKYTKRTKKPRLVKDIEAAMFEEE